MFLYSPRLLVGGRSRLSAAVGIPLHTGPYAKGCAEAIRYSRIFQGFDNGFAVRSRTRLAARPPPRACHRAQFLICDCTVIHDVSGRAFSPAATAHTMRESCTRVTPMSKPRAARVPQLLRLRRGLSCPFLQKSTPAPPLCIYMNLSIHTYMYTSPLEPWTARWGPTNRH